MMAASRWRGLAAGTVPCWRTLATATSVGPPGGFPWRRTGGGTPGAGVAGGGGGVGVGGNGGGRGGKAERWGRRGSPGPPASNGRGGIGERDGDFPAQLRPPYGELQRNANGEPFFFLSHKRRVTVCAYSNMIGVDLREYGRPSRSRIDDGQSQFETEEDDDEANSFKVPTKKGLWMTLRQYAELKAVLPQLDALVADAVRMTNSEVPPGDDNGSTAGGGRSSAQRGDDMPPF